MIDDPISFLPEKIKQQLYNGAIDLCARLTEKVLGDKAANKIRNLSTDAEFRTAFDAAMKNAARRFADEYMLVDEDLVAAIGQEDNFWNSKSVLSALETLVKRPGAFMLEDRETLFQHFSDVLPQRVNREGVDRAVSFILRCLAEELWSLPALQPIYQLQFQRITAEKATEMVRELRGLREDTQHTMITLSKTMGEQQKLIGESEHPALLLSQTPKVRNNLHSPSYEFIGRKEELAQVLRILRPYPHSQYPLVTIDGIGGVGKTALALSVAYYFVREFEKINEPERFNTVVWTSAKKSILTPSGIVPSKQSLRNLGDIYSELARTLERPDIISARQEEQDSLVGNVLSQSRVLLIVDNLETVDDPKVMQFLRELPAPTKAIITTRMRIDGAIPIRLEGMQGADRIALIAQECQLKNVWLSNADSDILARDTAGVPLAIVWTIGQIHYGRSVKDALLGLKSAGGDYAKFCFSESIELLQKEHKRHAVRLLMSLALFADSATREALGFVSGLQDSQDVRDEGLADLTRLSLINYDGSRFSVLPLTKEYATVELSKDLSFREEATNRWLQWHIRLTEQASGGKVDLDASVLASLRVEHTNILWAIDSSFHYERFDIYVKLLRGMEFFWFGTGHWREFERYLDIARNLVPEMSDKIHFAARLVWLYVMREDFKKAGDLLGYANKLLEEYPNSYERMRIEDFTGQMYMEMGELDKAETHLRESLRLARERPDRRGQFACLKYLGEVYCKRGNAEAAKELLKEAEPLAAGTEEDQWIRGLAHAFHLRGLISNVEEKWDEALISFKTCIDYLTLWPDERLLTRARLNLALAKHHLGRTEDARTLLVENKDTFQKLGMHAKVTEMDRLLLQWK